MTLKQLQKLDYEDLGFGTIQSNMTLKRAFIASSFLFCFGTIQSNMTLKQDLKELAYYTSFGTIQSNMTLKLQGQALGR